jgi:hypothetical protein|tara:strand:+ start:756 stop:1262 length:507 start_codon:yes stop_codon:yes gene_type:complete
MAGKVKMLKNMSFEYILGIVGVLILVFALFKYSGEKDLQLSGMQTMNTPPVINTNNNPVNVSQPVNNALSQDSSSQQDVTDPSELLPSNSNGWNGLNPNPTPGLENVSLLTAPDRNSINTVSSSLRNANLQLRSDPPNPRGNTNCPWNNSTIEGDPFRRPLEIGTPQN